MRLRCAPIPGRLVVAMLAALLALSARTALAAPRTSILVITADDLGPHLGCYGDSTASTPHLDRFAAAGMRFDRAYATQSSCSPSRSSMLTGLYPHQNGQVGLAPFFRIRPGFPSLPQILHDQGYRTGVIGKLHLSGIAESAFDVRVPKEEEPRASKSHRDIRIPASHVREFLDETGDEPFFLLVNLIDPHRPFSSQVAGLPESPIRARDVRVFPFLGIESDTLRQAVADYYNGIARVDYAVGLVLDSLEERGRLDDTLIFFLGDHGPGFTRAKTTCSEAGTHIACLMRWPARVPPGSSSDAFVSVVDLFPTIAEAAGVTAAEGLPGASLLRLAQGRTQGWRTSVFTEFTFHGPNICVPRRAVREGDVRLILNLLPGTPNPARGIDGCTAWDESRGITDAADPVRRAYAAYDLPPPVELYDLAKDPGELVNLADAPAMQETRRSLLATLQSWREATADPLLNPEELSRLAKALASEPPDSVPSPR